MRSRIAVPVLCAMLATPASVRSDTLQFEARVEMVNLVVSVLDAKGKYVPDLECGEFAVSENGDSQAVASCEKEGRPLRLVLLLDASTSMRGLMKPAKEAAIRFVQGLRPQDQASIILFGDRNRTVLDFTSDRMLLEQTILDLEFEDGVTKLYDHMYVVLKDLAQQRSDDYHQVVIVVTDARDTESLMSEDQLFEQAQRDSAVVYPIIIPPPSLSDDELERKIRRFAGEMAKATGGTAFRVLNAYTLKNAYALIAQELQVQYRLGYVPAHTRTFKDRLRVIGVKVGRTGMTVKHRQSYLASQP